MLWKHGLLFKLRRLHLHGHIYNFISDFLSSRSISVRVGSCLSSSLAIYNGVPQGSVLAPILFILMMNDFPSISDTSISTSLYADDSAIWRVGRNIDHSVRTIQTRLDSISSWSSKWGFSINASKTNVVLFTKRCSPPVINLSINSQPIASATQAKFLGLIFLFQVVLDSS